MRTQRRICQLWHSCSCEESLDHLQTLASRVAKVCCKSSVEDGWSPHEILSLLESLPPDRYVPPYANALTHAGLGNRAEALGWLERAYEMHDVHLLFLLVDPKWKEFRGDARFLGLLDRCDFVHPPPQTDSPHSHPIVTGGLDVMS